VFIHYLKAKVTEAIASVASMDATPLGNQNPYIEEEQTTQ